MRPRTTPPSARPPRPRPRRQPPRPRPSEDEAKAESTEDTAVELPAGAVAATEDGAAPEGYTVKGNADSGKYHVEGSQWYDQTIAEFWFETAEDAEAAGFEPAGGASKQQVDDEA